MQAMWADALLAAERAHVLRLALWGGVSVLVGTALFALFAWNARDRSRLPLLWHFGIQTAAWGLVDLVIAAIAWRGLELRDLAGATRLDRFLWLNIGLDVGYVGIGATIAITGWLTGRKLGMVGAGIAIVIQGLALALLDLYLTSAFTLAS